LLSERVLLAFDTGQGLVYAQASGWQRVYLLWTFRNFRNLPNKVLHPRQQKLIESLYCTASIKHANELAEAAVIGTVEDFDLPSSSPIPVGLKAEKLVFDAREENSTDVRTLNQRKPLYARLNFSRMTIRAGALALLAVIAVLAWRQLRAQPVSAATSTAKKAAAAQGPNDGDIAVPKDVSQATIPPPADIDAQPLPTTQMASAEQIAATPFRIVSAPESAEWQLPKSSSLSNKREPSDHALIAHHVVADLPRTRSVAPELPRVQIAGSPRKLVYPVCPETSVRGKVSLKAVVGYDGAVSRVRVLTGNRVLAAAAIEAVRQWRYQPLSKDGQTLERETNITVSFISNDVVAVSFPNPAPVSQ
jgi:TonB family protein